MAYAEEQVPPPTANKSSDACSPKSAVAEEQEERLPSLEDSLLPSSPTLDHSQGHWSDAELPLWDGYGFRPPPSMMRPQRPDAYRYDALWRAVGQVPYPQAWHHHQHSYAYWPPEASTYFQTWQPPMPYSSSPYNSYPYPYPNPLGYGERQYAHGADGAPASPEPWHDSTEVSSWDPVTAQRCAFGADTPESWAADDSGAISDTSPAESPRQEPGNRIESERPEPFRTSQYIGSVPACAMGDGETAQPPRQQPAAVKVDIQAQVKGILNRITAASYNQLQGQLLHLACLEGEALDEIARIIHKQVVTAPSHQQLYAKLCADVHSLEQKLHAKELRAGKRVVAFRRALLEACQHFFENPPKLPANFSDLSPHKQLEEEAKLKKQTTGNIQFIAELFQLNLLSEHLVELIVQQLLWGVKFNGKHRPTEQDIVMACTLLDAAGPKLGHEHAVAGFYRRLEQLKRISEPRIKYRLQDSLDRRAKCAAVNHLQSSA
eukprot:GGOE01047692.1.p1 GENE.GGOE01047692.1~~GGOE01047692.1.p1  ORF type:complete len:512 (-),score=122.45 GGOE01047692.1:632-2104(-)